ncbi:recombinase family protein [Nocardia transvalensis]|nr:recombinase family protein [Nocardia transvalensis]
MMAAITDIFNDTQNKLSGQDISIKMLNKAMNGGTCGRAKLGYVNARVLVEGRQVNTIKIDEERAPLVVQAWELYATGDYTIEDLAATMADLGLTCRPTGRWPIEQPVSATKLHKMLGDPYYAGYVVWKGQIYAGRHEPLVSPGLFARVQEVLRHRSANGNRDRVHNHYLKGALFCRRCHLDDQRSRLVFSESTGRNGTRYAYFVCRRSKEGLCDLPALPSAAVEDAIAQHYRTLQLPDDFVDETRTLLEELVADEQTSTRELHAKLNRQLKEIDKKEDRLVDFLTDGSMPQAKVRTKLIELKNERKRLEAALVNTSEELGVGATVLRYALDLIADPYALYRDGNPEVRRRLNETFYQRFYVDDFSTDESGGEMAPQVTDEKKQIFADLHTAARSCPTPRSPGSKGAGKSRNTSPVGGSNKSLWVGADGFEPPTAGV